MHNIYIAEWILALVTSRDRAASTAGDLAEKAATRGMARFWSDVLRTAASLLGRDVAENLARIGGLAFLGLVVFIGLDLLFAGVSGIAFFIAALAGGHSLHLDSLGWKIWFAVPIPAGSLLVGRMLARRAPGHELAACLVYAFLVSVYNLVPAFGDNGFLAAFLCILIVLAGAAWGRHRRINATQPKSL